MVKLHVKRGDESQFLYETSVDSQVDTVLNDVAVIYNGRLKVCRICSEMEELAKYGTLLPDNMMGLTDEQIEELKLVDEWGNKCEPSGGWTFNKDTMGRRNGKQPNEKMQDIIAKTVKEAKSIISKKQVDANICVTQAMIQSALDILRGAMMIVYPMNLPPHDVIRLEFENAEDLSGTQASLQVIDIPLGQLWFSGKEMLRGRKLSDYVGKNDKSKVIVKLQKAGEGPPARMAALTEEERKVLMMREYQRQEELKKLDADDDDQYLDSAWADHNKLKRSFQGLRDISWRAK